jgi:hypothetical protein
MEADMDARHEGIEDGNAGKTMDGAREAEHWITAIVVTWLLLTLAIIAGVCLWHASRDVDQACFQQRMNDEHTLMEAFFENPPEQNAVMQAKKNCSPAPTSPFA